MLLINFICLFYFMVLVRCDTISKSSDNIDSFDVPDEFNVLQDLPDPESQSSRSPRLTEQKRPWVYRVPLNNYQSTAALENILDNIKYNNMKQIASSPFGSTGMVFVTQPGYDMEENGFSSTKSNILNRENKFPDKLDAEDTTTELDEMTFLDNLNIRDGKSKRRTVNDRKVAFEAKSNNEKVKKIFRFKDIFKFLHPNKENISGQRVKDKQELLKEVPVLFKDELKADLKNHDKTETNLYPSVGSVSNVSEKIQRSRSNKDKTKPNIRNQRAVDTKESKGNQKWLPKFMKREPHSQAFESTVYEKLSDKLAYKDFVDGFKYYLNFEKDMAKSNFSDMVRYQAHMQHNVDDIGKFILEKLPQVPTTKSYESKFSSDQTAPEEYQATNNPVQTGQSHYKMERVNGSADIDYGINLKKYDDIQRTSVPDTPYAFNLLKKRLIDFRKPFWLTKSNSYSDSRTQSLRVRRHGLRFDITQFPQSVKTIRAHLKDDKKNVGFAKVTLVEATKPKKPYKGMFYKFKKHHSKRDTRRESKSSFFNKLRNFFSNGQRTTVKNNEYDLQTHLYDVMKDNYPYDKPFETNDIFGGDTLKQQSTQSNSNRFSFDDYGTDPLSEPKPLSDKFHIDDADTPFELTTPMKNDQRLQKEMHRLEQAHDYLSSKDDSGSKSAIKPNFKSLGLKDIEVSVDTAAQWSKAATSKFDTSTLPNRHLEDLKPYNDLKDILNSHGRGEEIITETNGPDAMMSTRPMLQHSAKSWETEFKNKLSDSSPTWGTSEPEIKYKLKEHHSLNLNIWHKNDPGFKNMQIEYRPTPKSLQMTERQFKNNLNVLSQSWKKSDLKFNDKQKEHHLSKIGQTKDENFKSKLRKQPHLKTWQPSDPELKKNVMSYNHETKAIFSSTSDTSEILNKANPANHFNIRPSMLSQLSLGDLAFHITDWSEKLESNDFTTDSMTRDAEKAPELDKTVRDVFENWSETPAALEVKTSKMPVNKGNEPEFHTEGVTMRDTRYDATTSPKTHNTDVGKLNSKHELMKEAIPETKVLNNEEGDHHYYVTYDHGIDDNFLDRVTSNSNRRVGDDRQRVTFEKKTVEKVTVEGNEHDTLKNSERSSPIHNKLLYATAYKEADNKVKNAETTQTTKKLHSKASLHASPDKLTQLKGAHKEKTTKGKCKQQHSRPQHLQATAPNNLKRNKFPEKIFDLGIAVTSTNRGSPSSMLDRFNEEFPGFTTQRKSAAIGTLVKEWFERHPDLANVTVPSRGESVDDMSEFGHFAKKWFDKHYKEEKKTTVTAMTIKNPNADKKQTTKTGKTTVCEKYETIDIGRALKDWLDSFDPDCIKKTSGETPHTTGKERQKLKEEKMETLDLGKLVKDWLDSLDPDTAKEETHSENNNKKNNVQAINKDNEKVHNSQLIHKDSNKVHNEQAIGKDNNKGHDEQAIHKDKEHVVKHMVFKVKDGSELDNIDRNKNIPATALNANDEGVPEIDKIYKNTFSKDEQTTDSENYRYLFESVPKYEPVQNHEYGPHVTLPINFARSNLDAHLKSAPKKSNKERSKNYGYLNKEKEQESLPKKLQFVRTFDIIWKGNGHMPSDNQSLNKVEAIFQKYSNLKKRNFRLWHMPSTTPKTPTRSKSLRQKRLTGTSEDSKIHEVCPNVTLDEAEMVDKRAKIKKRAPHEKHVVKNVAALEVLMDMTKANDEVHQTSVEKPKLKSHQTSNNVQVHLALPGDMKRSVKQRFRKIFTAKLFSPVDMEYQINSYDDTPETTMTSVLPPGMYLLVNNDSATSPRGNIILEPIPNDLSLSGILQRQYLAANVDLENKKVEESTQIEKFSKVTLSKEFVSAVNEHLVQLYEAFTRNATKMDETTRQFNKEALGNDLMTVNIELPAELQESGNDPKLKLHKRETKRDNDKRNIAFENIPVSDAVMEELVLEMNNLVEYMNKHCTEIQTYFRNNPSGGRKLRDTVRKVNKLVEKYSQCAPTCKSGFCKAIHKNVSKRQAELVVDPNKYASSNFIDDIEHLASDICNATKCKIHFNAKLYGGRNNLTDVLHKCVLGDEKRNVRSVTKYDKDEYSLHKVKVNIICKTEPLSTTPQQSNQMAFHWFVDDVNEESLNKNQWSLKNLLWRNKHVNKSKELMSRSWKREVGSVDRPLNADTGGSFWINYMHKLQKVSPLKKNHTSEEPSVTMNNEKEINPTIETSATADDSTKNALAISKCSNCNNDITTLTGRQLVKEATSTDEVNAVSTTIGATIESNNLVTSKNIKLRSNENSTNEHLYGKKERKIKPKHKEKHTKITYTPKPIANKGTNSVDKISPFFKECNSNSTPTTRHHVANTNSKPTQSTSVNATKDGHIKEVKISNKSIFALKQLLKRIPGYIDDKVKYTNPDVAAGPVPSSTANAIDSTIASTTPSLFRNVINQIGKTGDRTFKHWYKDNTVKYSGNDNSKEAKESDEYSLSNEPRSSKGVFVKNNVVEDDGCVKSLLLSILQYETKRMSSHAVCSRDEVEKRALNRKRLPKEHMVDLDFQVNLRDDHAHRLVGSCILIVDCTVTLPRGNYLLKPLAPGTFRTVVSKNTDRVPDFQVEIMNEASGHSTTDRDLTLLAEKNDELAQTNENRVKRAFTCKTIEKLFNGDKFKCECKPIATNQDRLDKKTVKHDVKKESKENRGKRFTWKKIKKWFHGNRACSCKCRPNRVMCNACAASDAVMGEVIFRLNNLVTYISDHSSEIENYFVTNPKVAAEFRKAVRETDKCLENYSKRVKGKCQGKLCEAFKYVEDREVTD